MNKLRHTHIVTPFNKNPYLNVTLFFRFFFVCSGLTMWPNQSLQAHCSRLFMAFHSCVYIRISMKGKNVSAVARNLFGQKRSKAVKFKRKNCLLAHCRNGNSFIW